jgi:hypothetical protein
MGSFPTSLEGNQTLPELFLYDGLSKPVAKADYSLFVDLFFILNLVSFITFQHTHFQIRRALKPNSQPANVALLLHIGISIFEALQYHIRAVLQPHMQISRVDLALTLIQGLSSIVLHFTRVQAGYKDPMHISFRIQPLLARPVATMLSMLQGNILYHDISLRISTHSFIYTRLIIFAARKVRFPASHRELYNSAALLGTMLAVHDSKINRFAAHFYLLATFAIIYFHNKVDTQEFTQSSRKSVIRVANRLRKIRSRFNAKMTKPRSNTTRSRASTTRSRSNTLRSRSNTIRLGSVSKCI